MLNHHLKIIDIQFGIVLTLIPLFLGCSDGLNALLAPFAPEFQISASSSSNGITIDFSDADLPTRSLSEAKEKAREKNTPNYTLFYAAYIYRAMGTPYENYSLIGRVFNVEAAKTYQNTYYYVQHDYGNNTDYIAVERPEIHLELYENFDEDISTIEFNGQKYFVDETAYLGETYFYRVEIVEYQYSEQETILLVNNQKVTRTNITHTLESYEVSSWVECAGSVLPNINP